jgi:hypothetical protein
VTDQDEEQIAPTLPENKFWPKPQNSTFVLRDKKKNVYSVRGKKSGCERSTAKE